MQILVELVRQLYINGSCTFVNPVPESVIAGQQGSIELTVQANSNATFSWGNAFYFPWGTPPTIGAGTTILLGYYIFELPSEEALNGKIMISGIEDLRLCIMTLEVFPLWMLYRDFEVPAGTIVM